MPLTESLTSPESLRAQGRTAHLERVRQDIARTREQITTGLEQVEPAKRKQVRDSLLEQLQTYERQLVEPVTERTLRVRDAMPVPTTASKAEVEALREQVAALRQLLDERAHGALPQPQAAA